MINKSNYFKIVALVVVMLLGTMSTWAATVYTNLDQSMFKQWDGVGAKASVVSTFSDNRYYNVGNVSLGNGATIYGDGHVGSKYYADLSEYEGIRIRVAGKSRGVRLIFNRRNDVSDDKAFNGMVEWQKVANLGENNGVLEIKFSEIEGLKDAMYYHLNAIKFVYDANVNSTVPELQVFKSDRYVSPCGNALLNWSGGYTSLSNVASDGAISTYSGLLTYTWKNSTNNLAMVTNRGINLSIYDNIILRTDELTQGSAYRVHLKAKVNGVEKNYYYLMSVAGLMSIPLSANEGDGWYDQNGYKMVKMDPSLLTDVQIFFGGISPSGSVMFHRLAFAKAAKSIDYDDNHCLVLGLGDLIRESKNNQGDFVDVADGIKKEKAEVAWMEAAFAYPVESPKTFRVNGTDNQINSTKYNFVENIILTNRTECQKLWTDLHPVYGTNIETSIADMSGFQIKIKGTGTLQYSWLAFSDGTAKLVSYNSDGGTPCYPMECVAGVTLPGTTKTGYQFGGWYEGDHFAGNEGDKYTTDKDVTLKAKWILEGEFNPAKDLVFLLDFNGMTTADLQKCYVEDLPNYSDNSGNAADVASGVVEKGKFYCYTDGKDKNQDIKGRIYNDPVFGQYYQNLAVGVDEYTESKAKNFLRYIITDEQQAKLSEIGETKEATVGFWVNGKIAVNYEFPLERGSMFCVFSDQRFRKIDKDATDDKVNISANEKPRYMFDISCNGSIYSYMPASNDKAVTVGMNKFYYGNEKNVDDGSFTSLFGSKYAHTNDQRQQNFYHDKDWHYITYVATEDLKYVKMYVDGVFTGDVDTRTITGSFNNQTKVDYSGEGDFPGRAQYLRNLVLGGFTPHGLFFNLDNQYYSDAALAYDDIAIWSRALSADDIKKVMAAKNFATDKWQFQNSFTAANGYAKLDEDTKHLSTDPNKTWNFDGTFYTNRKALNNAELTAGYGYPVLAATAGLKITASTGDVLVNKTTGLFGLKPNVKFTIPNVPKGYYVRFVSQAATNDQTPPSHHLTHVGERTIDGFKVTTLQNTTSSTSVEFVLSSSAGHWFKSIEVTPYRYAIMNYVENKPANQNPQNITCVNLNPSNLANYSNLLPRLSLKIDSDSETSLGSNYGGTIRYTSSAPHVASVNPTTGAVKVHGLAGYATITAELVSDNLFDDFDGNIDGVAASYEIRVTKDTKTDHAVKEANNVTQSAIYGVGKQISVAANRGVTNAITMTLGGWGKGSYKYDASGNERTDSWTKGFGYVNENDAQSIDGFSTATNGGLDAKSETYLMTDPDHPNTIISHGNYTPVKVSTTNVTPWELPCRGSYLKFEPEKAGVLTVYILQNGCLEETNSNQVGSDHIYWRPVYIADETGKLVSGVKYATNSKITPNDSYFLGGRRRAQFIRDIADTYSSNPTLRADLIDFRDNKTEQFETLVNNWENVGWKQKVIETKDGGFMVISKGIVRYTFNVYPGKTYYVFSNQTKLNYSGFNFEEERLLNINTYESDPIRYADPNSSKTASVVNTRIEFRDVLEGTGGYHQPNYPTTQDCTPVVYTRNFTKGKWASICLPFSMNNKQLKENFGNATAVVLLKKIHTGGTQEGQVELVWHANQDIIAGYPYFILPRDTEDQKDGDVIHQVSANVHFEGLTQPLFSVAADGTKLSYKSNPTFESQYDYPYVFTGNFKETSIEKYSYVMTTSGVLTKSKNNLTIKPFRAYLYCTNTALASKMAGLSVGGLDDEDAFATSIETAIEESGIILDSGNVYSVDGKVVRYNTHSLDGLSKGVYVVNGRKYVVK